MGDVQYWHMQLHPNDRSAFNPNKVIEILNKTSLIGLGLGWKGGASQVWQFENEMKPEDVVLIRDGISPIALVEVTGDHHIESSPNGSLDWFARRRRVKVLGWYDDFKDELPGHLGKDTWKGQGTLSTAKSGPIPEYIKQWHTLVIRRKIMDELIELLKAHKQLILTGAPGTGKTYTAKEIAKKLTDNNKYRYKFVQFHPSYDYTDFVEGLKPYKEKGGKELQFELRNGVFKEFCRRAGVKERIGCAEGPNRNLIIENLTEDDKKFWEPLNETETETETLLPHFVFIIDEINRAELSRVFGELFYCLEPDYRGKEGKTKTQYSSMNNEKTFFVDVDDDYFFIPSNVFIIGTMNDIDRSVETFDFAMRRRFAWHEVKANDVMEIVLNDLDDDLKTEAIERAKRLNNQISETPGLNESYHIGPAYFRKIADYIHNGVPDWEKLWNVHLEPLLKEYLRGLPNSDDEVAKLRKAYHNNGS